MRPKTAFLGAIIGAVVITAAHAAELLIDQRGQVFSDKDVTVAAGDQLTFANHDDVTHNISVFDDDDGSEDLGLQKPGKLITYRFDKRGRFKVRCSIHPGMKMTVHVK